MSDSTIADASARHDPKLVKHVARILSGLERPDWANLDAAGKKPHMALAKRVLTGIDRYSGRQDDADA